MSVPGKPFQPSLMFVGKARVLPQSGAPERRFTLVGHDLKIPTRVSLEEVCSGNEVWKEVDNNIFPIVADPQRILDQEL